MKGQFDDTAEIVNSTTLHVHGPVTDWEDDEVGAVIQARVQVGGMSAQGASEFIVNGDKRWKATLKGSGFAPGGPFAAYGSATVRLDDHTSEQYDWPDEVTLT